MPMTEAEWLSAVGAEDLWAFVRSDTRFNRHFVDPDQGKWDDYNQRLLYLLGVAVCRRLDPLFPDPCCQRMLEVAESFADGRATLDELAAAHEAVEVIPVDHLPAASHAAACAVFWLSPDDYKTIRILWHAPDAAGYLRAIAAGVSAAGLPQREAQAIWKHPGFLAGRGAEEQAVCDLIREVIGNLFHPSPPLPPAVLAWNDGTVRRIAEGIYQERELPAGALDNARLAILADALLDAGCDDEQLIGHCRSDGPHVRGCWAVDLILGKS
jgi:hypothetical protein